MDLVERVSEQFPLCVANLEDRAVVVAGYLDGGLLGGEAPNSREGMRVEIRVTAVVDSGRRQEVSESP
ncbi:hypothetical protein [Streptosporangium sp. NPDC006930]|uniref:hypothetical protein n=1 Tax=unclassified Streptosporangium TaxID=2632669 RepID=UPI003412F0DA